MANLVPDGGIGYGGGMNDSAAATAFRPDECAMAINFRVGPDTTLEVLGGSQRTHAAALNSGAQSWGATAFREADGTQHMVRFVGDTMYDSTDNGATWTSPTGATGLVEAYWSFATIADVGGTVYLCCANGDSDAYKYDGSTWSALTDGPAGPKYLATFNSRLYASDGRVLYASDIRDPDTFTAPPGIVVPVQTHDGDDITGLFVAGPVLLVFKRNSTAYSSGFGNLDIVVQTGAVGVSRSVGCMAPRSVCGVADAAVAWLSEQGVALYSGGAIQILTNTKLRSFMRSISWDAIAADPGIPTGMYDAGRQEYTCGVPVGGTQNNYDIIVNMATRGPTLGRRFSPSGYTLILDADGYLDVVASNAESLVRLSDGYVDLAAGWQLGAYADIDADGYLDFATASYDPAAYFTADVGGTPNALFADGYDGFLRRLEDADQDDTLVDGSGGTPLAALMIDRPRHVKAAMEPKQARKVEVMATSDTPASLTLSVRGDGVEGAQHAVSLPAGSSGRPQWTHTHVNVRGRTLEAIVRSSTARLRIAGIRMWAQILQRRS